MTPYLQATTFVRTASGQRMPASCRICGADPTRYLRGRKKNTYYCDAHRPVDADAAEALRPITEIRTDPPERKVPREPAAPAPAPNAPVHPEAAAGTALGERINQREADLTKLIRTALDETWKEAYALGRQSARTSRHDWSVLERNMALSPEDVRFMVMVDDDHEVYCSESALPVVKARLLPTPRDREDLMRKLAHAEHEFEQLVRESLAQAAEITKVRATNADLRSEVDRLKRENLALVEEALEMTAERPTAAVGTPDLSAMDARVDALMDEEAAALTPAVNTPAPANGNGAHPAAAVAVPIGHDRPRRAVAPHKPLADVLAELPWNAAPSAWRLLAGPHAEKAWKRMAWTERRQVKNALDRYAANPAMRLDGLPSASTMAQAHPHMLVLRAGQFRVLLESGPSGREVYDIVSRADRRVFTHER
jgi:hypothetical protein